MNRAKAITVLTVVALFGLSTAALAGWGRGYGRMGGASGQGYDCPYGNYGSGTTNNLSAEELEKLNKDQAEYAKETDGVRQKLYQKNLELRSELAKEAPDAQKASKLQGEISELQGELDQKRLAYQLKGGNFAPNNNRGYRDRGNMMGSGPRGGERNRW